MAGQNPFLQDLLNTTTIIADNIATTHQCPVGFYIPPDTTLEIGIPWHLAESVDNFGSSLSASGDLIVVGADQIATFRVFGSPGVSVDLSRIIGVKVGNVSTSKVDMRLH